ncbi:uncharacterized protein LOC134222977 [Armigeres subalbatus]|uniref:uncharacterized protein LOC134222977 n=1 Tax=Armigeres subalbatus TaxID=124917 RepID=UPI002ED2D5EE
MGEQKDAKVCVESGVLPKHHPRAQQNALQNLENDPAELPKAIKGRRCGMKLPIGSKCDICSTFPCWIRRSCARSGGHRKAKTINRKWSSISSSVVSTNGQSTSLDLDHGLNIHSTNIINMFMVTVSLSSGDNGGNGRGGAGGGNNLMHIYSYRYAIF